MIRRKDVRPGSIITRTSQTKYDLIDGQRVWAKETMFIIAVYPHILRRHMKSKAKIVEYELLFLCMDTGRLVETKVLTYFDRTDWKKVR